VGFATSFVQAVASLYVSAYGIGLPELRAIFLLGRYGRLAPIRIATLAATDRATVTRALRHLEERGLVLIAPDPDHQRRKLAQLTASGAALHDDLAALVLHRNTWLNEQFAADELQTLFALLQRLDGLAGSLPTSISPTSEERRTVALSPRRSTGRRREQA
jgi:DNA-binding MarR family transcriptional regulator